jgi:AcrR family transcriptional regulator
MASDVKRSYDSPLRRDQARATRRAIVDAAARLFTTVGYVATSIEDIAAQAGVSRATVFAAVGGKPLLLKLAQDYAVGGDDESVKLVDRPHSVAVLNQPDQVRFLEGYAAICAEVGGRVAAIHEAIRRAADADADARDLWERINEERRAGAERVVKELTARGPLREGLSPREAADLMWVLNDPTLYGTLVGERGWEQARFETWLAETLKQQLLPPRHPRRRAGSG